MYYLSEMKLITIVIWQFMEEYIISILYKGTSSLFELHHRSIENTIKIKFIKIKRKKIKINIDRHTYQYIEIIPHW